MEPSGIERMAASELDPDEFVRRFVSENTPVILEGALSEAWASTFAWTPGTLSALAPHGASVRVAPLMADGRDKWVESSSLWPGSETWEPLPGVIHHDRVLAVAAARIEVSLADFAASLRGEGRLPPLYADGASNLERSFDFLAQHVPQPPAVGQSLSFRRVDLWLGGRTLSTLHFDNYENLFVQLVGHKEFVLCPPGDTSRLVDGRLRKAYATWIADDAGSGHFERTEEGGSAEAVMNYAAYDIDGPPAKYAAAAAKLHRVIVRVGPGEVLYIPFGWWHQVRAVPAENGLCASAAAFYEPFFCRLQPKSMTCPGPLLVNPKYKELCRRLKLDESDSEGDGRA